MLGKKKEKQKPSRQRKGSSGEQEGSGQNTSEQKAESRRQGTEDRFLIVGIGASAGGLEAMEQFFLNMPADSGMAFIIVTHQVPGHHSLLPELLQKYTAMKVLSAEDGITVQPNTVYVNIPANDIGIINRTIQLIRTDDESPRAPINHFFRSLALDQSEKAIAILLSGMGSDGSFGIQDIKSELGMVMVQDPESAKYSSMMENAIRTGLVDYILSPDIMPEQLIQYQKHSFRISGVKDEDGSKMASLLPKVFMIMRSVTGHDFSSYKRSTVVRRVRRRMNVHSMEQIADYVRLLQREKEEVKTLFKEMLIGVTSFFRDPEVFELLAEKAFPDIFGQEKDDHTIRIWVPGCSTGEELYSIAILVREFMENKNIYREVQIFGTDISADSIDIARKGIYPASIREDVRPDRLKRFFTKQDQSYQIDRGIRETIVFAPHSIIKDPPFMNLDLICCRNLLIYLDSDLQNKLIPLFHYAIKPGGFLLLGTSESTGNYNDLFEAVESKSRLYKRRDSAVARHRLPEFQMRSHPEPGGNFEPRPPQSEKPLPRQIERLLMEVFTPSSVVINKKGEILYVHGKTGKFLEPAEGWANWNIFEMAREGLKIRLPAAVRKALLEKKDVELNNIRVGQDDGDVFLTLVVRPIRKPSAFKEHLVVSFQEVQTTMKSDAVEKKSGEEEDGGRLTELENELEITRESLQTTIEELETSNEELKSINEEYQATNEELQSANEELETSREEMQSLNEELQTVNQELQQKIVEAQKTYDDMKNFIDNLDIPTLMLDRDMSIQQFSNDMTRICNLKPADIGRPIMDISTNLKNTDLNQEARRVQKFTRYVDKEVQTKDGSWYFMRILPFRKKDNRLDGVIITFLNIDELKHARERIIRSEDGENFVRNVLQTVRDPLIVLDSDLKIVMANRSFYHKFRQKEKDVKGAYFPALGGDEWNISELITMLKDVIPEQKSINDFPIEKKFPDIGRRKLLLNARQIIDSDPEKSHILLAIEDVTKKKT